MSKEINKNIKIISTIFLIGIASLLFLASAVQFVYMFFQSPKFNLVIFLGCGLLSIICSSLAKLIFSYEQDDTEKSEIQKIVTEFVTKHNPDTLYALCEHIGDFEENLDPDADCGHASCPKCGACGASSRIKWENETLVDEGNEEEDEEPQYSWDMRCYICGTVSSFAGHKMD